MKAPLKITVVGGGPGGLYFALLTKQARPDWEVELFEQNHADDTFGFGVVFSDDTLDEFLSRDPASYERICDRFAYWDDIVIHRKGQQIRCAGNGFCGISRLALLNLLQERCREVGVQMTFGTMIPAAEIETRFADSDIILAADGIGSTIREHYRASFAPTQVIKSNRFCWMGSTRPLPDFTYFFKETPQGLICAHTYQYEPGQSTWVFEMSDDCWRAWGFEELNEETSKHKLETIFADELAGHPLILNRSLWRQFPRIFCNHWYHDKIVILGDAKASAHFSIGSGTKLAMECAIGLHDAVLEHAEQSVEKAFQTYDELRRIPVQIVQHNADVSLAWFEHIDRSWDMHPMQFAMVVMCRAKSITYDNLILRDPVFVECADTEWYQRYFEQTGYDYRQSRPTPMFTKFKLRDLELRNRVVMSPMAQYSADEQGNLTDWHFVHYTSHATGGMGMMYTEMTCPSPEARISLGCLGLWTDQQEADWKHIVDFVHQYTDTKICMQLGHSGRKGSTQLGWEQMDHPIAAPEKNWQVVSASPLAYYEDCSQVPQMLDQDGMDSVVADFCQATERASRAGFDMLELHCAHGYLLASFLSPLTNQRDDAFGGSLDNRLRFPLRVFTEMRRIWHPSRPMSVRVSASDWMPDGITEADILVIARAFHDAGCDLIDVSAGQTVPDQAPVYGRMFQVPFSEMICNAPAHHSGDGPRMVTMAVGNITDAGQVNTIIHTRRAELVAIGRPHLWNPYFTRNAAAHYGVTVEQVWEKPYLSGKEQAYSVLARAREDQLLLQKKARPRRHYKEVR